MILKIIFMIKLLFRTFIQPDVSPQPSKSNCFPLRLGQNTRSLVSCGSLMRSLKLTLPSSHARQVGFMAAQCQAAGNHLGRYVVVVDDDIDPTDTNQVLWALYTRVQPDQDAMVQVPAMSQGHQALVFVEDDAAKAISVFDLATGRNIAGPPPRPLPVITLEVVGDDIFATGVQERTT
jgi:hypothetical protein